MKERVNFKLYLITDRKQIAQGTSLVQAVRKALKGGARAVQLREKDLGTRELLKLAYKIRELTKKYNATLIVNDRFDIALAVGADGVHLTQSSIPGDAVRKSVGTKLLIGVSTHSLSEAREAQARGADFITFGPVYRTESKVKYGAPVGLDALKKVSGRISIPVFALGGIKADRINNVKKAGAYGVSMISEILTADDIQAKTKEINLTLN
jgi:thiamine-phosphate pyrophosphorylase